MDSNTSSCNICGSAAFVIRQYTDGSTVGLCDECRQTEFEDITDI